MKKLIALAVAGALAAPAYAAEISLGGYIEYDYISSDAAAVDDSIQHNDTVIDVNAVQELDNGMTVSATVTIVDDNNGGLDNQGTQMSISGLPVGTIHIGDISGALDATGDWTDKAPLFGGYDMDGSDMNLGLTLPTINGLTVRASMSPSGDNVANSEESGAGDAEGLEASAYSVTYAMGDFAVYYGEESYDRASGQTTDTTSYGVKYSSGPLYFAIEAGDKENSAASTTYTNLAATDNVEYTGVAATYTTGDLTLGVEKQTTKEKTETTVYKKIQDETVLFVSMDLGGGVSVFAANKASDSDYASTVAAEADQSAVGIKFDF